MKESSEDIAQNALGKDQPAHLVVDLDWRAVASQRLCRLVEIEHNYAMLGMRHEALQDDHRKSVQDDLNRLERLRILGVHRDQLFAEVADLAEQVGKLQRERTVLLSSRSWRVTKPMRAMARWIKNPRRAVRNGVYLLVSPPVVRHALKAVLRFMPGMRSRVQAFMHPHGP